jgi:hypothetical protein
MSQEPRAKSVAARFNNACQNFCKNLGGFGAIEAAIALPIFLVILFGVIEFGNMFFSKNQVSDVAKSTADYLQSKPSASSADLKNFTISLGLGVLKGTGEGENNEISAKLRHNGKKGGLEIGSN